MNKILTPQQAQDKNLITELAGQILHRPIIDVKQKGGCVSHNYEVNHQWIIKFPAKGTNIQDWEKQSIYTPKLQERLSYQIPVLTVGTVHLSKNEEDSLRACFYKKIEGEVIPREDFHQKSLSSKSQFFENLTVAMEELHLIHPAELPVPLPSKMDYLTRFLFQNSKTKRHLTKKILEYGLQLANVPMQNNILCHSDLHCENICINDKNHICGILDFDSLTTGDDWMEFSPHLYRQKDLALWREIYNKKAKHPLSPQAVKFMESTAKTIGFLNILGILSFPLKQQKKVRPFNKQAELIDIF